MIVQDRLQLLADWINERQAIYLRKSALERQPGGNGPEFQNELDVAAWRDPTRPDAQGAYYNWSAGALTHDPVLRQYRFCNVYREQDSVTKWINDNIRVPYADNENLWFMLCVARWINWPATLAELIATTGAWPTDDRLFTPEYMLSALNSRAGRGEKLFTGAYMITNGGTSQPKQQYVVRNVLEVLWNNRHDWQHLNGPGDDTMEGVHSYFTSGAFPGMGSFMAGQVTTDMRHTRYLKDAPDAATWAAMGPGSRRGLNRLHGRPTDAPLRQASGVLELLGVRDALADQGLLADWAPLPELTDLQNCLCEYDKYMRVRLGEGRPRALYVPGRGH